MRITTKVEGHWHDPYEQNTHNHISQKIKTKEGAKVSTLEEIAETFRSYYTSLYNIHNDLEKKPPTHSTKESRLT